MLVPTLLVHFMAHRVCFDGHHIVRLCPVVQLRSRSKQQMALPDEEFGSPKFAYGLVCIDIVVLCSWNVWCAQVWEGYGLPLPMTITQKQQNKYTNEYMREGARCGV